MRRVAGILLLTTIFATLFGSTVAATGWAAASLTWLAALALAALIILAIILIVGPIRT